MKQKYYKIIIGTDEAVLTPEEFSRVVITMSENNYFDGMLCGFTLLNYKPDSHQDSGDKELIKQLFKNR